jgi:DNA-binding IclR family transcriptional regulator
MRFYFDVQGGSLASRDSDGLEFPDLRAAIGEARATVLSMSAEAFAEGADSVTVQVRDTTGHIRATASLALKIV